MISEPKREYVQSWLIKAQNDLSAAKKLAAEPDPILDSAIYHCQQSSEKAIKAFLVFHDTRFDKTHNINALLLLAKRHETSFTDWFDTAELLTPYATKFRYPEIILYPSKQEVKTAIDAAENLYNFVLSLLPPSTHPQKSKRRSQPKRK
ncbi:MAG: HEPN domain-containing protein [Chloroflexota bacterium]|nr:MAG: HEPN domain-containing protein [Chloroflexota bacterium]